MTYMSCGLLEQPDALVEVLSFLIDIQVVLVADEYLVGSVDCPYAAGVCFVGITDIYAVEIEAEQQADTDGWAVHQSAGKRHCHQH